jgi:hypothetical protein
MSEVNPTQNPGRKAKPPNAKRPSASDQCSKIGAPR